MSSTNLAKAIRDDINAIGAAEGAKKYGVHINTVYKWLNGANPSYEACQLITDQMEPAKMEAGALKMWEGRKVHILMPVYRYIEPATHHTLMHNYAKYGPTRIAFHMTQGEPKIAEARNTLVQRFLKTDGEWAVFIDDDMILPAGSGDVMNGEYGLDIPKPYCDYLFLDRILSSGNDLIGALYFGKHAAGIAQYAEAFRNPDENYRAHKMINPGVRATDWVATGAMAVHRSVFERIIAAAPEKFPEIIPKVKNMDGTDAAYGFFNQLGPSIGEDVSFCLRAKTIGIQPFVDTSLVCGHLGIRSHGPSNTTAGLVKQMV